MSLHKNSFIIRFFKMLDRVAESSAYKFWGFDYRKRDRKFKRITFVSITDNNDDKIKITSHTNWGLYAGGVIITLILCLMVLLISWGILSYYKSTSDVKEMERKLALLVEQRETISREILSKGQTIEELDNKLRNLNEIVKLETKTINAIFKEQDARYSKDNLRNILISFAIGVISGLTANFIFARFIKN